MAAVIDFQADAEEAANHAPDDGAMRAVSKLCQQALDAETSIAALEESLKAAKAYHRTLIERDIPDAMLDCGLASVTLADGRGVEIKEIIDASPRAADKPLVYGWLREHGAGDLIKHKIVASFGTGDEEQAEAARLYLEEQHISVTSEESVHPQTLKKFVRDEITAGRAIPEDLFGVFQGRRAVIK